MNDLTRPDPTLLPCPFCGGEPTFQLHPAFGPRWFCDCGPEHAIFIGGKTPEEASTAWNRRVASACASAEPVAWMLTYMGEPHSFYKSKKEADFAAIPDSPVKVVFPLYASPAAPAEVPQTNADSVHLALPPAASVVEFPSRGWQSIDSAPKGQWLLVTGKPCRTDSTYMVARYYGHEWESADDGYGLYINPTHWMALPSSPSTAAVPPEPDKKDSSAPPSLQAVDTGGVDTPAVYEAIDRSMLELSARSGSAAAQEKLGSIDGVAPCVTEQDCTQEPWCRIKGKCQRAAGAALPRAVRPSNDGDALLIDNLFRAALGGDSLAIDTARMALRTRFNELRAASGVQEDRKC
jgi:hypothetical protein